MTSLWIAYSIGVSCLLSLAALALEHGLRLRPVPLRGIWIGALFGSLTLTAIPGLVATRSRVPDVISNVPVGADDRWQLEITSVTTAAPPTSVELAGPRGLPAAARLAIGDLEPLNRPILYVWLLASGLVTLALATAVRRVQRQRRSWATQQVDGVPAFISEDLGPAVVGFIRGRIVLPRWVLGLEARQRTLVLAHEEEHLRAGDPRLAMLALLTAVILPWNPAIWWQVRRLRHAVELDCDARVLRRCPDVRTYTTLLIELGRRRRVASIAVAAFAEPSSLLERRIATIAAPRPVRWRIRLAFWSMAALGTVAAALQLPRPALAQLSWPRAVVGQPAASLPQGVTASTPEQARAARLPALVDAPAGAAAAGPPSRAGALATGAAVAADTMRARFQPDDLASLAAREYPPALRAAGVEGEATLRFVVDREGKARQIEVLAQNRAEFAEAARRAVEQLAFWPARVGDQPVEDRVPTFPVRFRLDPPERVRAAPGNVERLLRAAITEYYPQLLREETARTPYLYLVVNERGDVIHHALEWSRPSTPAIRDAILERFPDLPRTRDAIPGGAGYSVRTGIQGGRDVEVFWATLMEPAGAAAPIAWGPYPLDAVGYGSGFPYEAVREDLRARHRQALERGIPAGNGIWYVATASGEIVATGIAPGLEAQRLMRERAGPTEFVTMTMLEGVLDGTAGAKIRATGTVLQAASGDPGVLEGRVTDPFGSPVAGVTVLFRDRKQGAVTRESGEYRMAGVPAGTHVLIARHPDGQSQVSRPVTLEANRGAQADFTLR